MSDEDRSCARCRAPEKILPVHGEERLRVLRRVRGTALGQINQTITLCVPCAAHLFGARYIDRETL